MERNITLKQLTDAEISRIVEGTEEYDINQNMILDMPLNATFRPQIQLSSIGSLKRSDIGLSETTVEKRTSLYSYKAPSKYIVAMCEVFNFFKITKIFRKKNSGKMFISH